MDAASLQAFSLLGLHYYLQYSALWELPLSVASHAGCLWGEFGILWRSGCSDSAAASQLVGERKHVQHSDWHLLHDQTTVLKKPSVQPVQNV